MSFEGSLRINIAAKIDSAHGLVTPEANMAERVSATFDSANCYYTDSSDISGNGNSWDLVGSLEEDLGDTVQFAKVYAVYFKNDGTVASANNMLLGSATNHIPMFTNSADSIIIPPQASLTYEYPTGITVTATTADTLYVGGTAGMPYELAVIGRRI